MAYRFTLRGQSVECDTVEELLAIQPATQADVVPTSRKSRARRARRGSSERQSKQGAAASRSWQIAKAYAQKNGLTVKEARSQIANSSRKKKAAERLLVTN